MPKPSHATISFEIFTVVVEEVKVLSCRINATDSSLGISIPNLIVKRPSLERCEYHANIMLYIIPVWVITSFFPLDLPAKKSTTPFTVFQALKLPPVVASGAKNGSTSMRGEILSSSTGFSTYGHEGFVVSRVVGPEFRYLRDMMTASH